MTGRRTGRKSGGRSDRSKGAAPFPTRERILDFIRDSDAPPNRREIARAFRLTGADRARLRDLLRELEAEGLVPNGRRRRPAGTLPEVTVIEVTALTADGDAMAAPVRWNGDGAPPPIRLLPGRGRPPGIGDRVLARLSGPSDGAWTAHAMKRLESGPARMLGLFRPEPDGGPHGGRLAPTDRRVRHDIAIPAGMTGGARNGDLVAAEIVPGRPLGPRLARIVENFGPADGPQSVSLICIHSHDIPAEFPPEAMAEAERLEPAPAGDRRDLRALPLVTIDGEDARDFDDAVWAEADTDPDNPGGWKLIVAIADVAWYVRPGRPLDREALRRGNSVYFPDRVVPMLPERLSNDLCSLRPGADRACIAARLTLDAGGRTVRCRFERAVMRSAARLTYAQVQRARDGMPDDAIAALPATLIDALYGAWAVLAAARAERQTLELDLPERRVRLNEAGRVTGIAPAPRYDSHRLIEEFMIAANVAAADRLARRDRPCMYRIHEPPAADGLETLQRTLHELGVTLPSGDLRPADLNRILAHTAGLPQGRTVHELVLRAQSQAVYSPENRGHFGLALARYAHFTSPIRRYADLLVHRALIGCLDAGGDTGRSSRAGDGLPAGAEGAMADWGARISAAERRAMAAERGAVDRYIAAFLEDRVGATFDAIVSGITRAGLFVTLDETGASGLIPMSLLPGGPPRTGRGPRGHRRHRADDAAASFRIGEAVSVRLRDAVPATGGLLFELSGGRGGAMRRRTGARPPGRRRI